MAFPYWQYFLAIESDFESTTRYVEVSDTNFSTYSVEYVRILLSACSEIDVIAKMLCERISPSKARKNINDYRDIITPVCPKLHSMKVLVPRYEMDFQPWLDWGSKKTPDWWNSYNAVKHQRDTSFPEANLKNTVNSVAGLFCFVLYYYYKDLEHITTSLPKIFDLETSPGSLLLCSHYTIPDDPTTLTF
jgi:hypothetical protein